MLEPVLADFGSLAESVFSHAEHGHVLAGNGRVDDVVAFGEADADDAAGRTAHGAHVFFGKSNRHALIRGNEDVVLAGRDLDVPQRIVFVEVDGNDLNAVVDAFNKSRSLRGAPIAILSCTVLGKGVTFMEDDEQWCSGIPDEEQTRLALAELGTTYDDWVKRLSA